MKEKNILCENREYKKFLVEEIVTVKTQEKEYFGPCTVKNFLIKKLLFGIQRQLFKRNEFQLNWRGMCHNTENIDPTAFIFFIGYW